MLANMIRMTAIILLVVAAVLVSLVIFGVFSGDEVKDALGKTLAVAGVILVASGLIVFVSGKK